MPCAFACLAQDVSLDGRIYWRYNVLYIAERCFESGGRIWDHVSCFPADGCQATVDKEFIFHVVWQNVTVRYMQC